MKKGFTLIEILVYISILVLVIFVISSFVIWSLRASTKIRVMGETIDNSQRAIAVMINEIKMAEGIYTPTSVFDTHPGQLSLQTEKYPLPDENTTYIDFYIQDGRLCLKKESALPSCITSEEVQVQNLVFRQIKTFQIPSVEIELQIDYKDTTGKPENQASITLRSAASLRSY